MAKLRLWLAHALTVGNLMARRLAPIRPSAASYRTSTLPLANCSDTGWRTVLTELTVRALHDGTAVRQGEHC